MNKIKLVCSELKITQSELAEMMGFHYTSISKWKDSIPKNVEITLNLLLENKRLKDEKAKIKQAIELLKNL